MVMVVWLENVSFLSSVSPRYFMNGDHVRELPLMLILLVLKVVRFEKRMTVVLEGLMVIFQRWNHGNAK